MLEPADRGIMEAAKGPQPLAAIHNVFDAVHRHAVKRRVNPAREA